VASRINASIRLTYLIEKSIVLERFKIIHAMITTYNHEINNPLAIAYGMMGSELSQMDDVRYTFVKKSLHRIENIVKRIEDLVRTTINFEKY
jgi:signal transduction histidine kinase